MTEASPTMAVGIGSQAEQLTDFANELEAARNAFLESYGDDDAHAKAKQAWIDLMWDDKGLFPWALRLAASALTSASGASE